MAKSQKKPEVVVEEPAVKPMPTLSDKLNLLAAKMNNMHGKSPDADLIREAAKALTQEEPTEAPKEQ